MSAYVLDGIAIKIIAPDRSIRSLDLQHRSAETEFKRDGGLDGAIIIDMIVAPQRQIYLANWGQQQALRISSKGVVSLAYGDPGDYGPEGLVFRNNGLAVFESLRPRANQGIVPRLLALGQDGEPSVIYDYFE